MIRKSAHLSAAVLLAVGCGDARDPAAQPDSGPSTNASLAEGRPVPASRGFSWVVPGELAAMPLPGHDRPLGEDAAYLQQEGVRVLVSLTENPPDGEVLARRAIDQVHIPIEDYTPPTLEQMIEFFAVVEDSVAAGIPVGVHCTAGLGRSGTMAAVYLVAKGAVADEAISTVRQLRPGSIETSAQEDAVRRFEGYMDGDR